MTHSERGSSRGRALEAPLPDELSPSLDAAPALVLVLEGDPSPLADLLAAAALAGGAGTVAGVSAAGDKVETWITVN